MCDFDLSLFHQPLKSFKISINFVAVVDVVVVYIFVDVVVYIVAVGDVVILVVV